MTTPPKDRTPAIVSTILASSTIYFAAHGVRSLLNAWGVA